MSYKRVCIPVLLVIPDRLLDILRLFSMSAGEWWRENFRISRRSLFKLADELRVSVGGQIRFERVGVEIFESAKRNLWIQKYPDTCGRGPRYSTTNYFHSRIHQIEALCVFPLFDWPIRNEWCLKKDSYFHLLKTLSTFLCLSARLANKATFFLSEIKPTKVLLLVPLTLNSLANRVHFRAFTSQKNCLLLAINRTPYI